MWKQCVTSHPYQMIIMRWSCVCLCDDHQDDDDDCNNEENVVHDVKKTIRLTIFSLSHLENWYTNCPTYSSLSQWTFYDHRPHHHNHSHRQLFSKVRKDILQEHRRHLSLLTLLRHKHCRPTLCRHNIIQGVPKKMLLEYHTLARPGQNLLICLPNVYELARFVAFFCECLNATFWGHSVYYYRDIVSYIEYKHCSPSNI